MMILKNQNKFLILILFLIFNCNNSKTESLNKFEQAKDDFIYAITEYEKCNTDYENKNNRKVIIDVRNGSGKKGLAKKISDYLVEKCYDTYYSNWDNFNEFNTRIIIYNNNQSSMIDELKDILDTDIEFEIKKDTTKIIDMTLIIGRDYQNLSFYENLNSNND